VLADPGETSAAVLLTGEPLCRKLL